MEERAENLRDELSLTGVDGFLVQSLHNVRYLCGFTGTSGSIVLSSGRNFFITDPRYTLQARSEVKGFGIRVYRRPAEGIAGVIKGLGLKDVGFESRVLTYDTYRKLKRALPGVRLKPTTDVVEKKRMVKDSSELGHIRKAVEIGDIGFRKAEAKITLGQTEKGVALSIEEGVKKKGAEAMAFDVIVASGKRSALPHGVASAKRIKKGEFVIVDMGVSFEGYKSDKTRTYAVGRVSALHKKIYNIVKNAQEKAIENIKAGVAAKKVDVAARDYIRRAGYGRFFTHGTGHGVGLEVHERPAINPISRDVLEEGMVVTVEPGIYIEDFGGVRIEDMVVVRSGGCEILTGGSRELRILE
ncbi:MAG: aminopeptidase P family protein [Deltaproteobacteria bacterium]|nr:aminopeptidase P family protein [Deltaproteobacteria bacterium]